METNCFIYIINTRSFITDFKPIKIDTIADQTIKALAKSVDDSERKDGYINGVEERCQFLGKIVSAFAEGSITSDVAKKYISSVAYDAKQYMKSIDETQSSILTNSRLMRKIGTIWGQNYSLESKIFDPYIGA